MYSVIMVMYSVIMVMYSVIMVMYSVIMVMYSVIMVMYSVIMVMYSVIMVMYSVIMVMYSVIMVMYSVIMVMYSVIMVIYSVIMVMYSVIMVMYSVIMVMYSVIMHIDYSVQYQSCFYCTLTQVLCHKIAIDIHIIHPLDSSRKQIRSWLSCHMRGLDGLQIRSVIIGRPDTIVNNVRPGWHTIVHSVHANCNEMCSSITHVGYTFVLGLKIKANMGFFMFLTLIHLENIILYVLNVCPI